MIEFVENNNSNPLPSNKIELVYFPEHSLLKKLDSSSLDALNNQAESRIKKEGKFNINNHSLRKNKMINRNLSPPYFSNMKLRVKNKVKKLNYQIELENKKTNEENAQSHDMLIDSKSLEKSQKIVEQIEYLAKKRKEIIQKINRANNIAHNLKENVSKYRIISMELKRDHESVL